MISFWKRAFAHGVVAGLIGYLVSIIFLAGVSLASGKSAFEIPRLLGGDLFYGGRFDDITAAPVIAFNGVYMLLYVVLGTLLGTLAEEASRGPGRLYASILVLVFIVMQMAGGAVLLDRATHRALPAFVIIAGGLVAITAMVAFLYQTHPSFRRMIRYHDTDVHRRRA